MSSNFAEIYKKMGADPSLANTRLLSISFDPEHDTPEVLAAHAARRGAKPPLWTFATAPVKELLKVTGSLGLFFVPGTREFDHNMRTAVIDPDGKLVQVEVGSGWKPADLLKTVYERLPKAGK